MKLQYVLEFWRANRRNIYLRREKLRCNGIARCESEPDTCCNHHHAVSFRPVSVEGSLL